MQKNDQLPKITVIIPTRERCETLKYSIQTVLAQSYENLELIVSDNFSNDDTEQIVKQFSDPRITYINTGKRVGMSQNWEFALSHVSEGWVTILGDDDGLIANALEKVAYIIKKTKTHAIRSYNAYYQWPGFDGKLNYGRLGVPLTKGWHKRKTAKWLAKVMNGKVNYNNLPMLYNGGYIDLDVLKEIKAKSGSFFRSMTPDVYMAIAISSIIPDYIYSFEPLSIGGTSKHSGGANAFSSKKHDENKPALKFWSEPNIPFHESLPLDKTGNPPLSVQCIVYEAYLQSKCLREKSEFEDHEKQLGLILASGGIHYEKVVEWGKLFAAKHNLNFEAIAREYNKKSLVVRMLQLWETIKNLLNRIEVGSSTYPIMNIYESYIAASTIQSLHPNLYTNRISRIFIILKNISYYSNTAKDNYARKL
jgi:glycosyltransferase involved in cell wall biosynthesis